MNKSRFGSGGAGLPLPSTQGYGLLGVGQEEWAAQQAAYEASERTRAENEARRVAFAIDAGRSPAEIEAIQEQARREGIPLCYICGEPCLDGYCSCDED